MQPFNLINSLQLAIVIHELIKGIEVVRLNVVQNCKKLFSVVLNGSPSEK